MTMVCALNWVGDDEKGALVEAALEAAMEEEEDCVEMVKQQLSLFSTSVYCLFLACASIA